jgi:hypothetical protein
MIVISWRCFTVVRIFCAEISIRGKNSFMLFCSNLKGGQRAAAGTFECVYNNKCILVSG